MFKPCLEIDCLYEREHKTLQDDLASFHLTNNT